MASSHAAGAMPMRGTCTWMRQACEPLRLCTHGPCCTPSNYSAHRPRWAADPMPVRCVAERVCILAIRFH